MQSQLPALTSTGQYYPVDTLKWAIYAYLLGSTGQDWSVAPCIFVHLSWWHLEEALGVLILQRIPGVRIPLLDAPQLGGLQHLPDRGDVLHPVGFHEGAAGPFGALIVGSRQWVIQPASHRSRNCLHRLSSVCTDIKGNRTIIIIAGWCFL